MYFFIFSFNDFSLEFTTFRIFKSQFPKIIALKVQEMIKDNKTYDILREFQIAYKIKNNLIFTVVRPYQIVNYGEINKIPESVISNLAEQFSHILTDDESDLIDKNQLRNINISERLENEFYPHDVEIRMIGKLNSRLITIFHYWEGYTVITAEEIKLIPYNLKIKDKHIMLKIFNGPERFDINIYRLLPKDTHIICIINDIQSLNQEIPHAIKKIIKESNNSKKVLIMVNNQEQSQILNLNNAEQSIGYPIIQFSATSPDAPELLEHIISDFVKD